MPIQEPELMINEWTQIKSNHFFVFKFVVIFFVSMHPHFCFVIPQCRLTTRPQSNFTKSKPRCALARSRSTSTNFFHELIPPLQQFFFPFFGLFGLLNFQFPQNFPFLNVTGLTSWPSVGIFDPLQYSRWKSSWFSLCYIFISRHPVQPIYFLWYLNPEW